MSLKSIRVTRRNQRELARLALRHHLHSRVALHEYLRLIRDGHTDYRLAVAFDGETPVSVAVVIRRKVLMAFTRRAYRNRGIARLTARTILKATDLSPKRMIGHCGPVRAKSLGFFNSLGVKMR